MKKLVIGLVFLTHIQMFSQTYNPEAAAEYAREYCNRRNPNYRSYDKDCANFVSQCLKAGGLDLSEGNPDADPSIFVNNGVDDKGCIPNVNNLITHLKNHQNTTFDEKIHYGLVSGHGLGDPAFMGDNSSTKYHATICSRKDGNNNKYSAHTGDNCNKDLPNCGNSGWHYITSFHINTIPAHCTNCELDAHLGETDIDCGGPCPSCQHAKNTVSYTSNTSNLPSETRAFDEITAGNANVEVLSGQDVTFITAGEIKLKPGFKVHKGGNFQATAKPTRKSVGFDCGHVCAPNRKPLFCRSRGDYFYWEDVVGAIFYTVRIYQTKKHGSGYTEIYKSSGNISRNGRVDFWDLNENLRYPVWYANWDIENFWYDIELINCDGTFWRYPLGYFKVVHNCSKSLSHNTDTTDDIEGVEQTFDVGNIFCFIHPNPNDGTFTINTNIDPEEIISVQVFSMIGQSIYKQSGLPSSTIQMPSSTSGMFYVEILTKTEKFVRKMVVY